MEEFKIRKTSISILGRNLFNLRGDLQTIENAGANMIHVDMLDNHFARGYSYPISFLKDLKKESPLQIDVHFMVDNIETIIDEIIDCNPDMVTFHLEGSKTPFYTIEKIKKKGIKVGLCLLPQIGVHTILPMLDYIDLVLVLSVTPGLSGQRLIESSIDKIVSLSAIKKEKKYNFAISIDGGVNDTNCEKIQKAGADILVSSSGFFNSIDKKTYINKLLGANNNIV